MRQLFIQHHGGLGDALICNGLVRIKAKEYEQVYLPIKRHNLPSVRLMYSDQPNIHVLGVAGDDEATMLASRFSRVMSVLRLGIWSGHPDACKPGWDHLQYEQAGVDFNERWHGFKTPAAAICPPPGWFTFIHEDIKRGFSLRWNSIKGPAPFHCPSPDCNGVIWDWLNHIRDAQEIHCIDSCFAILADSIETKAERLVLHRYARPITSGLPTYRKAWEFLD